MGYNAAKDNASTSNEAWKAQGFLNFYLPSKEGGKRRKLGAIPLKMNKPSEKTLLEWLNEDPKRAAKILAKLEIEYQSATPGEGAGFALD
jgi:hypothetical protein